MNFYQAVKAQLSPHAWVDFQANLHQLIRFTRVSQEPHPELNGTKSFSPGMEQYWSNVPEELQYNLTVEQNSLYRRAKRRKAQAFPTNNFA